MVKAMNHDVIHEKITDLEQKKCTHNKIVILFSQTGFVIKPRPEILFLVVDLPSIIQKASWDRRRRRKRRMNEHHQVLPLKQERNMMLLHLWETIVLYIFNNFNKFRKRSWKAVSTQHSRAYLKSKDRPWKTVLLAIIMDEVDLNLLSHKNASADQADLVETT